MQVKLFTIRLDSDNLEIDQNSLNDFLETVTFKKSDTHFVESEINHWSVLVHYENEKDNVYEPESPVSAQQHEVILSEREEFVFEKLKQWRNQKAVELGLKHFLICYNSELINIAIKNPSTIDELKKIKGFGNVKSEKYGNEIIEVLNQI